MGNQAEDQRAGPSRGDPGRKLSMKIIGRPGSA